MFIFLCAHVFCMADKTPSQEQVTDETGFLQELNGTLEQNQAQLERQLRVSGSRIGVGANE